MINGERGTIVANALWLLLIAAVGGGLFGYTAYQFSNQNAILDDLKQDLIREHREQEGLKAQVARMEELYRLIGSELASTDERFSDVLSRAIDSKGEEIEENRKLLEATRSSLDRIANALEEEVSRRAASSEQLKREIEACQKRIEQSSATVNTIAERVETLRTEIDDGAAERIKDSKSFHESLEKRLASMNASLTDLQARVSGDLNWLQGELQRLDRRIDDLNHELRRVESRRPE